MIFNAPTDSIPNKAVKDDTKKLKYLKKPKTTNGTTTPITVNNLLPLSSRIGGGLFKKMAKEDRTVMAITAKQIFNTIKKAVLYVFYGIFGFVFIVTAWLCVDKFIIKYPVPIL